jgi:hypothetical protein
LNLYASLRGPDAKFVLIDRKWKKLSNVKGWTNETSSGYFRVVTEKGETEIIKLMPCTEHECWKQNGRVAALFFVIDDPSVVKEESLQKK